VAKEKGGERNGKGERGQKGEGEESWNRAADWLRPALISKVLSLLRRKMVLVGIS